MKTTKKPTKPPVAKKAPKATAKKATTPPSDLLATAEQVQKPISTPLETEVMATENAAIETATIEVVEAAEEQATAETPAIEVAPTIAEAAPIVEAPIEQEAPAMETEALQEPTVLESSVNTLTVIDDKKGKNMKVLFIAAEAAPFIKVGGLGDVMGSLPKTLIQKGIDARVVLPLYSQISQALRETMTFVTSLNVPLGWRNCHLGIFKAVCEGVTYYLLDNEMFFNRANIYGEFDDAERFAYFSKAALEIIPHIDFMPDIIHANDWHTALVPVYLNAFYRGVPGYDAIKTVLSIHNIEFQGKYDPYILGNVFGLDITQKNILMYDNCINVLKGGIESADAITTVSETYSQEILHPYFSFGLDGILRPRNYKLTGIVNGIDTDLFNPETDKRIPHNFSIDNIRGKAICKKKLQIELGLPDDSSVPVIGMITRLTSQKGLDLLEEAIDEIMKLDIQLIVLGTGYPEYEELMLNQERMHGNKMRSIIAFNLDVASKIYAGADMFLMPSKSEPCGLAQMIAMRYGTVPIVHRVGGLRDTVIPFSPSSQEGNGITFESYNPWDMFDAIRRGVALYDSKDSWIAIRKNCMLTDFSWDKSADKYIELYEVL